MTRKIIAIFAALLLTVSLFACAETETTEETTGIKIENTTAATTVTNEVDSDESETEAVTGGTVENNSNPSDYSYSDCNETAYVYIIYDDENKGGTSVTLRAADYEYITTLTVGDKVTKIGVSNDENGYWSKVTVGDKTGYIASKFLTSINVLDPAGFEETSKTVNIAPLTGSLNVRDIPSMDSNVIGWVTSEAPVKVIAENADEEWYKIEFVNTNGETEIGYIASNANYFVQEETTEETTEAVTEENTTETAEVATSGK